MSDIIDQIDTNTIVKAAQLKSRLENTDARDDIETRRSLFIDYVKTLGGTKTSYTAIDDFYGWPSTSAQRIGAQLLKEGRLSYVRDGHQFLYTYHETPLPRHERQRMNVRKVKGVVTKVPPVQHLQKVHDEAQDQRSRDRRGFITLLRQEIAEYLLTADIEIASTSITPLRGFLEASEEKTSNEKTN